jgi:hypothetical protein
LSADVARSNRDPVRKGDHRFLPFVYWRFEVEDIEPSPGQLAFPKKFQEARAIDDVPP